MTDFIASLIYIGIMVGITLLMFSPIILMVKLILF